MTLHHQAILCAISLTYGMWVPPPPAGPVMLANDDDVVVYETFYRGGKIEYTERNTSTSQEWKYQTLQPPVANPPIQNYWESTRRSGNRSFVATSSSPDYAFQDSAGTSDSVLWVFRPATNVAPSAVVITLRNPQTSAGGSGSVASQVTLMLPPQSIAYGAMLFRKSVAPIQVTINNKTFPGGDSAGFFEVARNDTMTPLAINVSGLIQVASTTFHLTLTSQNAGSDVMLVSGQFGTEPVAFAAAIIMTHQ